MYELPLMQRALSLAFRLLLHWNLQVDPLRRALVICLPLFMGVQTLLATHDDRRFLLLLGACAISTMFASDWLFLAVRFYFATIGFRELRANSLVCYSSPQIEKRLNMGSCAVAFERALGIVAGQFGFDLTRPPQIYLFNASSEIARILRAKRDFAGYALYGADVVLLVASGTKHLSLNDLAMHEFVHLYASRWSRNGPSFKDEGLSTWFVGRLQERSIELSALVLILIEPGLRLNDLVELDANALDEDSFGAISGSFTGFLIRRWGWQRYGVFYRDATAGNLVNALQKVYNIDILAAELQWRQELLCRRADFEPELSRIVSHNSRKRKV